MTDLKTQTCSRCAAFHRESIVLTDPGHCRLNPPNVVIQMPAGVMVAQPQVAGTGSCLQWRPKPSELN